MTRSRLLMLIALVTAALSLSLGCRSSETRAAAPSEEIASDPCGGACGVGQRCCTSNCDGSQYCVTKAITCPILTCPPDLQAQTLASAEGESLVECDGDSGERRR